MVLFLTGEGVMIADSTMVAAAFALVLVRMWFRLIYQRMSLTLSDIFLLLAAAEVLAMLICFVKEYHMGKIKQLRPDERTPLLKKLTFATILLYDSALYFLKFSILSFYFHLFPITTPKLRKALYVICVYTSACFLCAMFMATFWCGPDISELWASGQSRCSVWDKRLFVGNWVMNISSDLMILALPFPLLAQLKLSMSQVIGLCITFGLGLITIAVSICRFVAFFHTAYVPLYVWSMAELTVGMMVVSLPALRPLLRRAGHAVASNTPGANGSSRFRPSLRRSPNRESSSTLLKLSPAGGGYRTKRGSHMDPRFGWGSPFPSPNNPYVRDLDNDYELRDDFKSPDVALKSDVWSSRTEEIRVSGDRDVRSSSALTPTSTESQRGKRSESGDEARTWFHHSKQYC